MNAICCNHKCDMFERTVTVSDVVHEAERARCVRCNQLLVHATGLTFRDYVAAREAGEDS